MAKTIISIENLSKVYRMGTIGSGSLRDDFTIWWANLQGKENPLLKVGESVERIEGEYLWALRDINLEVKEGEILGIIGANGAGKSTLLKILSRITSPTKGEFHLGGRLSSLIEVGTGFHGELTGRENIYLNGAIHGMKRDEIDRRLDEIVDFAGVGEYIDTPVKRYSSGMYVRLGFAVAAHLSSEILLVDEVLAVGDVVFQKKALGKMNSIAEKGKTVLFVSHNLNSIRRLCTNVILFSNGKIIEKGETYAVTQKYLEMKSKGTNLSNRTEIQFPKNDSIPMHLDGARLTNENGEVFSNYEVIETSRQIFIEIEFTVLKPSNSAYVMCGIEDQNGMDILWTYDGDSKEFGNRKRGKYMSKFSIPAFTFTQGTYILRCAIVEVKRKALHYPGPAFSFTIIDNKSLLSQNNIGWPCQTRMNPHWETKFINSA